jgi:ABC-type transport system involved in multi-copper enzyme maturation permease subunit
MTLLPVVERELRVASRRVSTYWGRTLAAALGLGLCAWFIYMATGIARGSLGPKLFMLLAGLAFLFTALSGMFFSADSVSMEKREGTLGLLFLTDLRAWDIALGKLSASSLAAVYSIFAIIPVLALSLLLGGTSAAEYLRVLAMLFSTLVFSLTAGLMASVSCQDGRRASVMTLGILLMATFFPWAVSGLIAYVLTQKLSNPFPAEYTGEVFETYVSWMSPLAGWRWVSDADYVSGTHRFWASIVYTLAGSALCLGYAIWRLPKSWQTSGSEGNPKGWGKRIERIRFPNAEARAAYRAGWLESAPTAWLAGRRWWQSWMVGGFVLLTALAYLILPWPFGRTAWNTVTFAGFSYFVHLVLKIWVASEAPRQLLDDRRSGAIELLLSTPLAPEEYIRGGMLALRRQFLTPILVVLLADLIALFLMDQELGSEDESSLLWIWISHMIVLPLDTIAAAWVGLWVGLSTHGSRPTFTVLNRILGIRWLIYFGFFTALSAGTIIASSNFQSISLVLGTLFVVAAGNDIYWSVRSHQRILANFRTCATTRPGEPKIRKAKKNAQVGQ